jgi:hypothetical protein
MGKVKKILKFLIPSFILLFIKKKYSQFLLDKYKNLNTYEVFEKIYKNKVWTSDLDKKKYNFYSGLGSHLDEFTNSYISKIINFLKQFNDKKEVIELGCGDFVISSKIVPYTKKFIATDIFDEIINDNKKKYKDLNVNFRVLDMTKDLLPESDICIVRCVLQHLSNDLIIKFLKNISNHFEYLIITEHYPSNNDFNANKDIITGPDIRLSKNSAVDVVKEPFNLNFVERFELCRTSSHPVEGYLITEVFKLK